MIFVLVRAEQNILMYLNMKYINISEYEMINLLPSLIPTHFTLYFFHHVTGKLLVSALYQGFVIICIFIDITLARIFDTE